VLKPKIILTYLPANQAWCFLFGSDIMSQSIEPMGDHGRFFRSRDSAVAAAASQGLRVQDNGLVYSTQGTEPQ
jgi:hypothetical protein